MREWSLDDEDVPVPASAHQEHQRQLRNSCWSSDNQANINCDQPEMINGDLGPAAHPTSSELWHGHGSKTGRLLYDQSLLAFGLWKNKEEGPSRI